MAGRQHRLVLQMREHAEGVFARHVLRREDGDEPGRCRDDGVEIAQRKFRPRMRRAHHAHPERVGGRGVGAEEVGAGDLGPAIRARKAGADDGGNAFPSPLWERG